MRVLVEVLLLGGRCEGGGSNPPLEDEAALKEWIENKLKALASLPGRLGMKPVETLPGSIEFSVGSSIKL